MTTSQLGEYLSSASANALISDLRPTTVSPPALQALNNLLDEILVSILTASQSLNPFDLRKEGVPSVFSADKGPSAQVETTNIRALGRSAVAEAEVELRSWQEGRNSSKGIGFGNDGQGDGMRNGRTFNLEVAINLMRIKCCSYSTMAAQENSDEGAEEEALAEWKKAGGEISEDTIEPAALWITAIIEHVCEHILSQLASVVSRDSEVVVAGPEELYTALCEDESVWVLFKKMKVKEQLEGTIRASTRNKRATTSRHSNPPGRASPHALGSPHASRVSLVQPRDSSFESPRGNTPPSTQESRSSVETNRFGGIAGGVMRKGSQISKKSSSSPSGKHHLLRGQPGSGSHERTGSALSENTRSMLGAHNDSYDGAEEEDERQSEQSIQDAQDEFDALVRSGETMKVSLTPSRLKNFDGTANRRRATESPNPSISGRSMTGSGTRSESVITPSQFPTPPRNQPGPASASSPSRSSPITHSSPTLSNRPRADSAQRRLQARAASTIEENVEDEDEQQTKLAGPTSKKESLLELLASEEAYEPISPTKKNDKIKRKVPAVVLGTPPPPPIAESESENFGNNQFTPQTTTTTSSSSPSTNTQSQFTSPHSLPRNAFSPHPTLTRSQFSSSSLNRPNGRSREVSGDEDDDQFQFPSPSQRNKERKKTEAQELADFFNNTPPPDSSPTFKSPEQEEEEEIPEPQTAKPGKGFRALVSKVTKSRKDKTANSSSSLSTSASYSKLSPPGGGGPRITGWAGFEDPGSQPQLGQGGGMGMPKKQKSLHSLSTVPVAFRPFAREEDFINADNARRGSTASKHSDILKEATNRFHERRGSDITFNNGERRGSLVGTIPDRRGSAAGVGYTEERRGSLVGISAERGGSRTDISNERRGSASGLGDRKMVGLGIATLSDDSKSTSSATAVPRAQDDTAQTRQQQSTEDASTTQPISEGIPTLGQTLPLHSTQRPDLDTVNMPGSAASFRTANSVFPEDQIPSYSLKPSNDLEENETEIVKNNAKSSRESISQKQSQIGRDSQKPTIRSIPSSDLIPLRSLLDHATTVQECQSLLDAMLSQLGVPRQIAGRGDPIVDEDVTESKEGMDRGPAGFEAGSALKDKGRLSTRTEEEDILSGSEKWTDYETDPEIENGVQVTARIGERGSPVKVVRGEA
ncbi:uncharacterized protein IL334_004067 [Kwoniella shivajii]|uniref:Uncharacterized protein n=1 Tax=Kwoniella shivajii TaxID=564305 RepID=A0ABZ1D2C1_9TREE|nr:hypothetical protein IL334_004067 [Kwoniella shivajii]